MRIVNIRERTVPISRFADPTVNPGGLDTTAVAITTDVSHDGAPIVGFGFTSVGRFGQGGLIRERFAPRLMAAAPADQPLFRFLAEATGNAIVDGSVSVYAAGGYRYPSDDVRRLTDEIRGFLDGGYTRVKIKIGGVPLADDLRRIDAVLALLPSGQHLAVDAMNAYDPDTAIRAARALLPYRLRWFEDICDPLDFEAHARIADDYPHPLGVGEALFSASDARNLLRYGGLRPDRDVLLFDPAHCYGVPGYLEIIRVAQAGGWPRSTFQPHGGHLFSLHLAAGLGLGGSEANPHNFQPFGGFADGVSVDRGRVRPPEAPGIGFETRAGLRELFESLLT